MYTCERCGTGFGLPDSVPGSCPRCLARDGVRVALAFRRLAGEGSGRALAHLPEGLEAEVRRRLGSGATGTVRHAG